MHGDPHLDTDAGNVGTYSRTRLRGSGGHALSLTVVTVIFRTSIPESQPPHSQLHLVGPHIPHLLGHVPRSSAEWLTLLPRQQSSLHNLGSGCRLGDCDLVPTKINPTIRPLRLLH